MRYAILAAGLLAAAVSAGSAAAQGSDGKFCAQIKNESGKPLNCSYNTMTQCEAAVKNDQGICFENPTTKM